MRYWSANWQLRSVTLCLLLSLSLAETANATVLRSAETASATVLRTFALFGPLEGECDGDCMAFGIPHLEPPRSFEVTSSGLTSSDPLAFTFGADIEAFAAGRDKASLLEQFTNEPDVFFRSQLDVGAGEFLFQVSFGDTFFDESHVQARTVAVSIGNDDASINSSFTAVNDEGARLFYDGRDGFSVTRGSDSASCDFCDAGAWEGFATLQMPEPALPIPEPWPAWLLISGLFGLAYSKRG